MPLKTARTPKAAKLRELAEARLRKLPANQEAPGADPKDAADSQRLLHELQVHQLELEMQNAELHEARDGLESLLGKYTDLYDFAPVGYFTLATDGSIQMVNLTGASLVGIDRSKLVGQSFAMLVTAELRPVFEAFLADVFADHPKPEGDFHLLTKGQAPRTVKISARCAPGGQECSAVVVDITERAEAEASVRVSEIRYRRLFEAAHDGVLLLDPDTRKITDSNPFMTTLLGYPHEQLVGKELFEIGLLKDESASQEMFENLRLQHQVRYEDLPLESQDGRHQEVEVVANLYQENGRSVIQCNIRDITERKHAELAVNRLAAIVEFSDDAIIGKDLDSIISSWNTGAERLFGYTADEVVGTSIMRLIPDDRQDDEQQIIGNIKEGKSLQHFETMRKTKDGRLIHVSVTTSPVRSADGEIIGVSKIARDITARKHAEDILRRNAAMMAALIEQLPVGVYVVDAKFRMRQVNPKAQPVFADIHPHIGRDFAEVVHILWRKKIADQVIKRFRHTLKTGEPYHVTELAGTRRDLRVKKIYEWSLQRITLSGGEHSVVCFFEDITERREAELALRRLAVLTALNHKMEREMVRRQVVATALETSQQTTSELLIKSRQQQEELRDLSHRLLTAHEEERKRISRELHDVIAQALAGINMRLSYLKSSAATSPEALEHEIEQTQRLVSQSVDTVHRFARDLRPSMLDFLGLVPALEAYVKEFTERTCIPVSIVADKMIERLCSSERTVLYRIAQEALTNVDRHAKASCVAITILQRNGRVCMDIHDDGLGFEVEGSSCANKPSRLGMLGMKERVEMIGGSFRVESELGQSTIIRVEIPIPQ